MPNVMTPIAPPVDTHGWTSATLEVRASSVRRRVRVLTLSMRVGPDDRVEPDGSEPVGVIDVEGQGDRLLVAALSTPLPGLVGVYLDAEPGVEGADAEMGVQLVWQPYRRTVACSRR